MDSRPTVIKNIRRLAAERRLSMNRLADFAGVDRGNLSRIMSGKQSPTLRTLDSLAVALDVETAELVCLNS